jgi:hypothetical protein
VLAVACSAGGGAGIGGGDDDGGDAGVGSGSGSGSGSGLGVEIVDTTIHDERGDTIDFATGEPNHTHAGAPITLGATGCPAVFKYGYLLDPTRPFGKESTPNPIAWKFRGTGGTIWGHELCAG